MSAEYKSPVKNGGGVGGSSANISSNSDGTNSTSSSGPTTPENNPNNSIMSKVKSRVSSILPNSLTKWFTPSNRNGNSRRRRHDDSESDEFEEDNRQIPPSSDTGGNNLISTGKREPENRMPPSKRTRLDEGVPLSSTPNNNLKTQSVSSIVTKKRRKQHGFVANNAAPPFNFKNSVNFLSNIEQNRTNGGGGGNDDVTDEEIDDVLPISQSRSSSTPQSTFTLENRKRLNIPQTNPAAAVHNNRNGSNRMFGTTINYQSPISRQQQQRFTSNIPPQSVASSSHCIIHEEVDGDDEEHDIDDDDAAEDEVELNGNVNESASESGCESTSLLLSSGTNLVRPGGIGGGGGEITRSQSSAGRLTTHLSIDQHEQRRGGLYGTVSSTKRGDVGLNSSGNLNFSTHLQSNKSLFSDKNMPASLNNSTTSLTSLNRRHSLTNASSLFGSTSALSDSRLLNTTTNSPFYKGRTMYGGASAYSARRASFAQRTVRVPTQIRPASSLSSRSTSTNSLANIGGGSVGGGGGVLAIGAANGGIGNNYTEPNATPAISNTAKRILDLMNQFTSPLSDIKKMATRQQQQQQLHSYIPALVANRKRFDETDIMVNRSIRMQTPKTPYSRPSGSELAKQNSSSADVGGKLSPMVTELQVPSMSQLLQMKKHLQNKTEKVRELASSSQSILNKKPSEYKPPIDQNNDNGKKDARDDTKRKIRNKIASTRARQSNNNNNIDDEIVEPVNLPNIQLEFKNNNKNDGPIWNMTSSNSSSTTTPMFNSKISTNSPITTTSAASIPFKPQTTSFIDSSSNKLLSNSNNLMDYKFSNPLESITPSFAKTIEPITNFEFSKPICANEMTINDYSGSKITQLIPAKSGIETTTTITTTKPSPPLLKTGSVLDALKKPNVLSPTSAPSTKLPEPITKTLPSLSSLFKGKSDQWECSSCMLKNDNARLKCVACEGPKPGGGGTITSSSSSFSTFSSSSKINSFNTTPKPSFSTNDTGFKNIVAQQNEKWECFACMTRNESQRKKCICCEMDKPVGATTSKQSAPSSPFTSSTSTKPAAATTAELSIMAKPTTTDEEFKNIVAQQSSKWECSDCMTRNDSSKNKCDCCEKAKPGAVAAAGNKSSDINKLITPVNLDTGFKNIVAQQSAKWECTACMTRNDSSKSKCDCCEMAKPGSTTTVKSSTTSIAAAAPTEAAPKFSFGVPFDKNAKSSTIIPETTTKTTATTVPTFSFGIPSTSTNAVKKSVTAPTFSFGTLPAATVKPQISATATDTTKKDSTDSPLSGFKFGAPSSTITKETATSNIVPLKSTSTIANTLTESPKSNTFTFGTQSATPVVATTPKTTIETPSTKPLFSFGSPSTSSTTSNAPIMVGNQPKPAFSFGATSPMKPPPSTVSATPTITSPSLFGAPPTANKPQQIESDKNTLSNNNNGGGIKFGLPSTTIAATTPVTTKPVSFVFGSGSQPITTSSISNTTNNDERKGGFSFSATIKPIETIKSTGGPSASPAPATGNLISFGGIANNSLPQFGTSSTSITPTAAAAAAASTTKSIEPIKSNFIFGSASSTPTSLSSTSLSTNINAHSTLGATPTFGSSASSNITTTNNFFGAAAGTNIATTTPAAIGSHFGGSPAPSPSTSLFGSAITVTSANNTTNNVASVVAQPASSAFMFSSAATSNTAVATPTFGQSASTATFGQPQQQQQQHTSQLPTFGSFGNSQAPTQQQQQQQQPSVATFGSPSFGNASPFGGGGGGGIGIGGAAAGSGGSGNATPSFGQQIPTLTFGTGSAFGAIQPQTQQNPISFSATPLAQGFNARSSDEPQTKKLFGSGFPTGNNSNIQKPPAYSFGAVANTPAESKTPFSFSTNTPPSFNFSSQQPTQQLNQPYAFGATNNVAPSSGVFNFGSGSSESTTNAPFQFAAEANNTNIFSPQPTTPLANATQQRRKIRAVRRNIR